MEYFRIFIVPMVISLCLVPFVRKFAIRYNLIDRPNERSMHDKNIPLVGGVAVLIAFLAGSLIFSKYISLYLGLILGSVIVFTGGFIDDIREFSAKVKLLFQLIAALIVIWFGSLDFDVFHDVKGTVFIYSLIVSLMWIIGITNAINLLDGLDGLSSGYSIITLLFNALIAWKLKNMELVYISLILAGSVAGFLPFNFHPASIFIGDCGAQMLGFVTASLTYVEFNGISVRNLFPAIVLLFIPILDTLSAVVRRTLNNKKWYEADKGHLHHRLMCIFDGNVKKSVLVYCALNVYQGLAAYMCVANRLSGICMIIGMTIIYVVIIKRLHMFSGKPCGGIE